MELIGIKRPNCSGFTEKYGALTLAGKCAMMVSSLNNTLQHPLQPHRQSKR
jgi:hypothetical protein